MRAHLSLVLIFMVFGLSACQTTSSLDQRPVDVTGAPLAANDLKITRSNMYQARHAYICHIKTANSPLTKVCAPSVRENVVLQMRFNGQDFAYRVAWAPHDMVKPSPDAQFDIRLIGSGTGDAWLRKFTIYGVNFTNAQRVTSPTGNTYWLSDWIWNPTNYKAVVKDENYLNTNISSRQHKNYSVIRGMRESAKKNNNVIQSRSLQIYESFDRRSKTQLEHKRLKYKRINERSVFGEEALAALAAPEDFYEARFAAKDRAMSEEKERQRIDKIRDTRYVRFLNGQFVPLSVHGQMKKCPALPYRMAVGQRGATELYAYARQAMARADCIADVIEAYDPNPLIERYEAELDREAELFAKTSDKQKRFSLEKTLGQTETAQEHIQTALTRADWLNNVADQTARRSAQRRQQQQRQRAAMQSFVQALNQVQSEAQRQYDQSASRLRAIQRQAVRNHNRQRRAANSWNGRTLPQPKPVNRNASRPPTQVASHSVQETEGNQQQVFEPRHTVYMATSMIRSIKPASPHGCTPDKTIVSSEREYNLMCTGLNVIRMYRTGSLDPRQCPKSAEFEGGVNAAFEVTPNSIIGSVSKIENLTEVEARRLIESGNVADTQRVIFYRADKTRAENTLIEYTYRLGKTDGNVMNVHYKDRTEIIGIAQQNGCKFVIWLDGATGKGTREALTFN